MMVYADYSYYRTEYGGTRVSEEDFQRLSRRASRYLDAITFKRASEATDSALIDMISDACCALAEEYLRQEQGGEIASASNDGYSETYVTTGRTAEQRMYAIACELLGHTGLLYRGVCGC